MSWFFREEAETLDLLGRQFEYPDHYFVLDVETSGFSFSRDLIVEVGWGIVRDRRLAHNEGLILNWTTYPQIDREYLQQQLIRIAHEYAAVGRVWHYPWERLADEGVPPLEGIWTVATLLYEHIKREDPIVGHGLWRFDRKMIDAHTQRFLKGYLLPWRHNSIFDTGLLEKAAQMCRPPYQSETLDEWLDRVNRAYSKAKWNLGLCVQKYQLLERYNLDMRLQHTAGFDCRITHLLMETYRELTEILHGRIPEPHHARSFTGPTGGTPG